MRCYPPVLALAPLAGCLAVLLTTPPADAADHGRATIVGVADAAGAGPDRDHHGRVRVIRDDGAADPVEIDLSGLGEAIDAAMQGVSRALAELDTVQVVSERGGRRLIIRESGHEAVVDVDAIMGEVNRALALAFSEVGDHADAGRPGAAARIHREARGETRREVREVREERDDGRAALRAEIDSLRRELATLQEELRASRAER
ncbi:MAG: hypothetical protein ACYDIE_11720 [Candidatus Krumholzibacteriia bacterium]